MLHPACTLLLHLHHQLLNLADQLDLAETPPHFQLCISFTLS